MSSPRNESPAYVECAQSYKAAFDGELDMKRGDLIELDAAALADASDGEHWLMARSLRTGKRGFASTLYLRVPGRRTAHKKGARRASSARRSDRPLAARPRTSSSRRPQQPRRDADAGERLAYVVNGDDVCAGAALVVDEADASPFDALMPAGRLARVPAHLALSRSEAESRLATPGEFLLRPAERGEASNTDGWSAVMLSFVDGNGQVKHVTLEYHNSNEVWRISSESVAILKPNKHQPTRANSLDALICEYRHLWSQPVLRSSVDSLRVRSGSSAETFAQLERTLHSNHSTLSSLPLVEVIDDLDNDAELEAEPENESENEKEDPPPPFITLPGFERENDTLRVTVHAPQEAVVVLADSDSSESEHEMQVMRVSELQLDDDDDDIMSVQGRPTLERGMSTEIFGTFVLRNAFEDEEGSVSDEDKFRDDKDNKDNNDDDKDNNDDDNDDKPTQKNERKLKVPEIKLNDIRVRVDSDSCDRDDDDDDYDSHKSKAKSSKSTNSASASASANQSAHQSEMLRIVDETSAAAKAKAAAAFEARMASPSVERQVLSVWRRFDPVPSNLPLLNASTFLMARGRLDMLRDGRPTLDLRAFLFNCALVLCAPRARRKLRIRVIVRLSCALRITREDDSDELRIVHPYKVLSLRASSTKAAETWANVLTQTCQMLDDAAEQPEKEKLAIAVTQRQTPHETTRKFLRRRPIATAALQTTTANALITKIYGKRSPQIQLSTLRLRFNPRQLHQTLSITVKNDGNKTLHVVVGQVRDTDEFRLECIPNTIAVRAKQTRQLFFALTRRKNGKLPPLFAFVPITVCGGRRLHQIPLCSLWLTIDETDNNDS